MAKIIDIEGIGKVYAQKLEQAGVTTTDRLLKDGASPQQRAALAQKTGIADGLIQEVSDREIRAPDAQVVDVGGRTLMPGLIDAHLHAYASDVSVQKVEAIGEAYRTAHAVRMLGTRSTAASRRFATSAAATIRSPRRSPTGSSARRASSMPARSCR